jgi:cytochrome c oxidase subunit II
VALVYGEPQVAVGLTFAAIALTLAITFALIARRASAEIPFERVRDSGYRLRRPWFGLLIVLLGGAVAASLFLLPYSSPAGEAQAQVKVSGGQFYWSLNPPQVPAGTKVEFDVTSVDVNHGFGVYDPDGQLLGSVQAMPGYHNHLVLQLDQPGRYMISCLEFCGVKHHEMRRDLEVVEGSQ